MVGAHGIADDEKYLLFKDLESFSATHANRTKNQEEGAQLLETKEAPLSLEDVQDLAKRVHRQLPTMRHSAMIFSIRNLSLMSRKAAWKFGKNVFLIPDEVCCACVDAQLSYADDEPSALSLPSRSDRHRRSHPSVF